MQTKLFKGFVIVKGSRDWFVIAAASVDQAQEIGQAVIGKPVAFVDVANVCIDGDDSAVFSYVTENMSMTECVESACDATGIDIAVVE